jgi:ABC-type transport system involved in multi-copper enzyme maturation permease subunit
MSEKLMITALPYPFLRFFSLSWLTGPIFEKELRVSSRRKRNYVLRVAYVVLLTFFIVYAWMMTTRSGGSGSAVYQLSRMPEVGKHVVTTVVWFQFIAIQLIAVLMMSMAINEEIHHRTLGVLMTTPIGSFQIVLGKLLSKLLQLILLLALSMPLLAIVRVFGGVPWAYVTSGLCVTLTSAVFAGALSLLFSTFTRQSQQVLARTASVCFIMYSVPLIAVQLIRQKYGVTIATNTELAYANPFIVMTFATTGMLASAPGGPLGVWPIHCTIMAGLSGLLLIPSAVSVRRAALRQATGQPGIFSTRKERRAAKANQRAERVVAAKPGRIIPVKGHPIVWKEMRTLLARSGRFMPILSAVLAVCIGIVAYVYCGYKGWLALEETHAAFVAAYLFLGLLRATTSAALSITSEREARTWPVLLTTSLTDKEIVRGKIIGSALQAWPFWLLLATHILVFSILGYIPVLAVIPLAALAVTSALLVSAIGVFFSSSFKRSSVAGPLNLIVIFVVNFPVCCPVPTLLVNPIFIAIWILGVTGEWDSGFPFMRTVFSSLTPEDLGELGMGLPLVRRYATFIASALALIIVLGLYLLFAFAASALARRKIRRGIF